MSDAALSQGVEHGVQSCLRARLRAYWSLIKSRQTLLLLATGLAGYLSARPEAGTAPTAALMTLALFATISGTTALNMVFDRDIDAQMGRTAGRPLPSGMLSVRQAALFGAILVAMGLALAFWLSPPFGWVIGAGIGLDLGVYTLWLKRRSPWSIIFGGVSGGMPILAGRVLGMGAVDGLGLLLALSVLLWIPAHILTFAMKYDGDYRQAGVPTWPAVYGFDSTRRFIAVSDALRALSLVAAGWWLSICPWSLGLLALSGVVTVSLSIRAVLRSSEALNLRLFKFASVHMLGSMVLLTLGALL
ncbi:MAG: protoheme IX farnesyltransferase [Anaerolineae bacterium]